MTESSCSNVFGRIMLCVSKTLLVPQVPQYALLHQPQCLHFCPICHLSGANVLSNGSRSRCLCAFEASRSQTSCLIAGQFDVQFNRLRLDLRELPLAGACS